MPMPLKPTGLYRSTFSRDPLRYRASGEFRPPLRGEFYTSGAVPIAYQMLSDGCRTSYWIARAVSMETCPFCDGTGWIDAAHDPNG